MSLHLDITNIPDEVRGWSRAGAALGQKVKAALQSNTSIEVTALVDEFFPEAVGLRTELIALCDAAINTCSKIYSFDYSGVTARLQRMVTDSAKLLHNDERHGISTYIMWVEVEIRDLLDSAMAAN